ncbi:hypothetical protein CBM2633_B60132 [Cupriavidus taiwanensis]|nr:hypothetical protein CBM2633_B60132 [Cupriavidus taiwanensis]
MIDTRTQAPGWKEPGSAREVRQDDQSNFDTGRRLHLRLVPPEPAAPAAAGACRQDQRALGHHRRRLHRAGRRARTGAALSG